jgi:hypothetical protein
MPQFFNVVLLLLQLQTRKSVSRAAAARRAKPKSNSDVASMQSFGV